MSAFLKDDDIAILTGRKVRAKQIDALRKMGLPFFVNALGKPVVSVSAIEGRKEAANSSTWKPKLVK